MAVDGAVADVLFHGARLADGHDQLDPLVGRAGEPRQGAAAAQAGDGEAVRVDVGPCGQVVEGPHRRPDLHARRRVALAVPVPPAVAVHAVMEAGVFADLDGVEDQGHVAMLAEPPRVGLVVELGPRAVPAHVNHGRQPALGGLGPIEIGGDAAAGNGLEMEFFDRVTTAIERAGDGHVQVGPRRQRVQAQHLPPLPALGRQLRLPGRQRGQFVDRTAGDGLGTANQRAIDRGRLLRGRPSGGHAHGQQQAPSHEYRPPVGGNCCRLQRWYRVFGFPGRRQRPATPQDTRLFPGIKPPAGRETRLRQLGTPIKV
jgi:hypothetical protein